MSYVGIFDKEENQYRQLTNTDRLNKLNIPKHSWFRNFYVEESGDYFALPLVILE